ncbi:hypothetical protein N7452_007152 [Penicillium brevicompactum]|uniref:Uncharacterized protein n=1 Tax=Penicillium brevicompactum TaxID=5074 RepID=A0A9W9QEQ3_PENBR|nr:hypothetical protein N7452_007152 [Penicillium brevicompactum]
MFLQWASINTILSDTGKPTGYKTSRCSLIECLFHPTHNKLSAFKWTYLDPLSISIVYSN